MRRPFALALFLAAAFGAAGPARAATPKAPAKPAHAAAAQAAHAAATHAQAARLEGEIAQFRAQLVQLAAVESSGERQAGDRKARLDQLNAKQSALNDRIGRDKASIARLLGALELYRRNPPPAFLVYPASAKDAVRAQILARAIAPELEERSRALAAQALQVQRLRREVDAASDDLFRSESDLAEQRARIEGLIAQKLLAEQTLYGQDQAAQARLKALADASGAPSALIGRLPAPDAARAAPAGFLAPVQGRLLATFGEKTDHGRSQGMAWRAAPGAPVLAPANATVEYAGPLKGWGVVLILDAGGAYHLVLTGLQAASATTGRSVAAGEPIGRMADDAASPTDLYLEVRHAGEPVDPARWLKLTRR